ncbi:hypothetical protein INR49_031412 [Caranx melampygus]|nr:hypothetical protein INR49_031412 [Caranx melampygus]
MRSQTDGGMTEGEREGGAPSVWQAQKPRPLLMHLMKKRSDIHLVPAVTDRLLSPWQRGLQQHGTMTTVCKRLEQDLIQEREQRATKDELLRCRRERDGALDDMQRLEAELQALRANCRSDY